MLSSKDPAVNWLLDSGDPSIRYLTLTEILDRHSDSKEVLAARKQIPNGPIVKTLLSGQQAATVPIFRCNCTPSMAGAAHWPFPAGNEWV